MEKDSDKENKKNIVIHIPVKVKKWGGKKVIIGQQVK